MSEIIETYYEKMKADYSKWAIISWIISGVVLFVITPNARIFSWQAVVFFVPGIFFASLCVGLPSYLLMRLLAKIFVKISSSPSTSMVRIVRIVGWLLFLGSTVVTFIVAKLVLVLLI